MRFGLSLDLQEASRERRTLSLPVDDVRDILSLEQERDELAKYRTAVKQALSIMGVTGSRWSAEEFEAAVQDIMEHS